MIYAEEQPSLYIVLEELWVEFVDIANPQQVDLRLSRPSSSQGTDGRTQIIDRGVLGYLKEDSLTSLPLTPSKNLRELKPKPVKRFILFISNLKA
ncbi:hypothetical protein PoB_005479100 [Plakobranchus ocellatus]|uniref:Uncharacterized protein n=1 Tax=Plakobranchus ocellatus TaxID=259542 RepID=A0AAV4BYS4_9GAST|nr:hypothetical protein PoB_005479100 [Plakobranchus ocellatus]